MFIVINHNKLIPTQNNPIIGILFIKRRVLLTYEQLFFFINKIKQLSYPLKQIAYHLKVRYVYFSKLPEENPLSVTSRTSALLITLKVSHCSILSLYKPGNIL